jgi:HlyD family secretion protein
MSNELVASPSACFTQVPRSTRGATLAGYGVLLFGVGGFVAWAALAPLDGAVISPGNFVATSQNKIVQHLEGGIIREILVKEGDLVEAGQPLMRLDRAAGQTELTRLEIRQIHLQASVARLEAQVAGLGSFTFPSELVALAREKEQEVLLDRQMQVFEAQEMKVRSDIEIQARSAAAFKEQIKGFEARLAAVRGQVALVDEELAGKERLFKMGLLRKPEYFALKRSRANLVGEEARLKAEMQDAKERMAAAEKSTVRSRQLAVSQAAEDLEKSSGELEDVAERIGAARGTISRLEVKAPVKGSVVKLNYHTAGGVIRPGADIMALLPAADELIIEVNVRPQDIANVKTGQEALVRLTALNQRTTPMIPGSVIYVSADALPDERKMRSDNIYIARVELDPKRTVHIDEFLPTPGMPAEVYIKTGRRTFFEYLARPVIDTMSRAFRES